MESDKKQKKKVRLTAVITLLICLADIYIIINTPKDYIVLSAAALITIIFSILALNSWFKWKEFEAERRDEQYSDIMKAEKGSYVVIQKKVQDLDEKLNFIGQKIMPLEKSGEVNQRKIASMLDSIMEDQKKVAKITISRSKENADALMNSNDKLMNQMEEFRNSIESMQKQLLTQQGELFDKESQEIANNTDELFNKILELKTSLEKATDEITENILTSRQTMEEIYSKTAEAESRNIESIVESALSREQHVWEDIVPESELVKEQPAEITESHDSAVIEAPVQEPAAEPVSNDHDFMTKEQSIKIEEPEISAKEQPSELEELEEPKLTAKEQPSELEELEEPKLTAEEQPSELEELEEPRLTAEEQPSELEELEEPKLTAEEQPSELEELEEPKLTAEEQPSELEELEEPRLTAEEQLAQMQEQELSMKEQTAELKEPEISAEEQPSELEELEEPRLTAEEQLAQMQEQELKAKEQLAQLEELEEPNQPVAETKLIEESNLPTAKDKAENEWFKSKATGENTAAMKDLISSILEGQSAGIKEEADSEPVAVEKSAAETMIPDFTEEQQSLKKENEFVKEPVVVEELPVKTMEQTASEPVKKNSDYIMNPEDIAALIANTQSEILPDTTQKFETEEKPPMPDMSDPNRPMSPEDIAALIANL